MMIIEPAKITINKKIGDIPTYILNRTTVGIYATYGHPTTVYTT